MRLLILVKTIVLAVLALYLTVTALLMMGQTLRAQVAGPPNVYQLQQEWNSAQLTNEKRFTVLETVNAQTIMRLNMIESNMWKLLLGVASLVGETVWAYVSRAKEKV